MIQKKLENRSVGFIIAVVVTIAMWYSTFVMSEYILTNFGCSRSQGDVIYGGLGARAGLCRNIYDQFAPLIGFFSSVFIWGAVYTLILTKIYKDESKKRLIFRSVANLLLAALLIIALAYLYLSLLL